MTAGRAHQPRTATDLRWVRGTTAGTLWAFVAVGVLLQLVLGVDGASGPRLVVLIIGTTVATLLATVVVPLVMRGSRLRHPLVVALVVVVTATWAVALVAPFAGWAWGFLLAVAGGMVACLVSRWRGAVVIVATLAVLAVGGLSSITEPSPPAGGATGLGEGADLVIVSTLVLLAITPVSTVWVLRVVLRLEEARRTAADLAVATERLRFATDLHDIQGHHLQVIALKGELAERRLAAGEPALAATELAEIRRIAQAALDDTRAVVNDYRTVTVAVEARNAAAVLRSAGIACEARIDAPDLPPVVGTALAVAIREATTNILRHSRATRASVDLVRAESGGFELTVVSDGAGEHRQGGTGIVGIRQRVAPLGGTVDVERRDDTFTLVVRIPATVPEVAG